MNAWNPDNLTGLHPIMRPAEKRKDIRFDPKDEALRQDVHDLGFMVGELLKEQCGEELFGIVEEARQTAIERREGDRQARPHLDTLVGSMDMARSRDFLRAFSTYFQVVNTAEVVHRIRRRMDYMKDSTARQPGSIEDTIVRLRDAGLSLMDVQNLFEQISIEPVFTAHPTEPTRRTILRKQQNIVKRMLAKQNPGLSPQELSADFESIRADVTTIWQTAEHGSEGMTVFDELEHVLFFMTDVIYRAVPAFYEAVMTALVSAYGREAADVRLPVLVRFASWIGGDMVGRTEISARTIREALARQRRLILNRYHGECRELLARLSQSTARVDVEDDVLERIRSYKGHFPNAYGSIPARHRDMPYRVFLRLIMERLLSTFNDDIFPYESAEEFLADIRLIAISLKINKGEHAGLFAVQRLMRRIQTFGFHFMTLDIRQSALDNRKVIGTCLGEEDWLDANPELRAERIRKALERNESPSGKLDNQSKRAHAVFQAIAFCRRKYGQAAIGPYIVSQAAGIDDVLSVILLARWAELRDKGGRVPLDIAPAFETVEELADCRKIAQELLADPTYRVHLEQRGNRQTIMLGHVESNKDAGMTSAHWSLHLAQAALADCMHESHAELTLFHGRGGHINRSSAEFQAALPGAATGALAARLRATEAGEHVNTKYGVRSIALRTLEQAVGSVAVATALPHPVDAEKDTEWWHEIIDTISHDSRMKYRGLIYSSQDFFDYFCLATPVDVIDRMQMGFNDVHGSTAPNVASVRAATWMFAWNQSRHFLPGWYGAGTALLSAIQKNGIKTMRDMIEQWPFFRNLVLDVEMELAKCDLGIARRYSKLAGDLHERFFPSIQDEYDLTVESILELTQQQVLLEDNHKLRRAIRLRNPYVDPMSLLQVSLLRRWREGQRNDQEIFEVLVASINGITRGLQDAG